jgi:hypothetical protein
LLLSEASPESNENSLVNSSVIHQVFHDLESRQQRKGVSREIRRSIEQFDPKAQLRHVPMFASNPTDFACHQYKIQHFNKHCLKRSPTVETHHPVVICENGFDEDPLEREIPVEKDP